jgi:uncharacterized protein
MENQIIDKVRAFVIATLVQRLPGDLYFHNLSHTLEVAAAAVEIGLHSDLSPEELGIVTLAAWFHDVGYCSAYMEHEIESAHVSRAFLRGSGLPETSIEKVISCILATKFPQKPQNRLEEIICDADFYHFSRADYPAHEQALRKEWEIHLHLIYTDEEWNRINYEMLKNHSYFTPYGKTVLQDRKKENIKNLAKN